METCYCEVIEEGFSEITREVEHKLWMGVTDSTKMQWAKVAGRCLRCVHIHILCIHMQLVSAEYGFLHSPSVSGRWNHSKIHLVFKLFPNISIALKQIYSFKTSITAALT